MQGIVKICARMCKGCAKQLFNRLLFRYIIVPLCFSVPLSAVVKVASHRVSLALSPGDVRHPPVPCEPSHPLSRHGRERQRRRRQRRARPPGGTLPGPRKRGGKREKERRTRARGGATQGRERERARERGRTRQRRRGERGRDICTDKITLYIGVIRRLWGGYVSFLVLQRTSVGLSADLSIHQKICRAI